MIVCDHDRRIADERISVFQYDRSNRRTFCDLRSAIVCDHMETSLKGPPQDIVLVWYVPFLLCAINTMKHLFRLIMPLDLTLPCFHLAFGEKYSFIPFIYPTDVRPTCVVCFAWGFPFQLGRSGMKTKWSLQFL